MKPISIREANSIERVTPVGPVLTIRHTVHVRQGLSQSTFPWGYPVNIERTDQLPVNSLYQECAASKWVTGQCDRDHGYVLPYNKNWVLLCQIRLEENVCIWNGRGTISDRLDTQVFPASCQAFVGAAYFLWVLCPSGKTPEWAGEETLSEVREVYNEEREEEGDATALSGQEVGQLEER